MLFLYFFRCKNYYKNNVRNYVILLYIMQVFVLSWKKKQKKQSTAVALFSGYGSTFSRLQSP